MLFSRIINNKVSEDLICFAQLWFATKFQALKSFAYISHQFNVWLTFYIRKQHVLQLIEHISQRVDLRICRFVYTYVDSFSFSFILEFSTHRFSCFFAMHEAWQMPNNILFFSFFPFSFNVKRTHTHFSFAHFEHIKACLRGIHWTWVAPAFIGLRTVCRLWRMMTANKPLITARRTTKLHRRKSLAWK